MKPFFSMAVVLSLMMPILAENVQTQDAKTIKFKITNKTAMTVEFFLNGGKGMETSLKAGESATYDMTVDKGVQSLVRAKQQAGKTRNFGVADGGQYVFRTNKDGEVQLFTAAPAELPGWEKFTSKEYHFTVSFPGAPKVTDRESASELIAKDARFEAAKDGVEYSIGCIVYAKSIADKFNSIDPKEFAQGQREAIAKRTKGTILIQKDITLGKEKRPGYELLIEVPQGFIRQRAFYVNGRLIQSMITGKTRETVTDAKADHFQNSLNVSE